MTWEPLNFQPALEKLAETFAVETEIKVQSIELFLLKSSNRKQSLDKARKLIFSNNRQKVRGLPHSFVD